ncbi:MAG: extracellular solute-binding protein [Spirochaetales bacterium]
MKKMFLLVCIFVLCFTGIGFARGNNEQESIPVIWAKSGPEGDALLKAADVYLEQTGKQVNVVIQGRSNYRSAYNTALLAGSTELDAVLDTSFVVPTLAASGSLLDVTDYIELSATYDVGDFEDVIVKEMQFNDKWYMFPSDISSESLVYRTDLFGDAPETWDELIEKAVENTKSINPNSETEYGYAYSAAPGLLEGTFQGIMKAYGGQLVDESGRITVNSSNVKEAYQIMIDMRNVEKITPPDITAWDYPELLTALQEGIVASASFFTAGMPLLISADDSPKVAGLLEYSKQPAGPYGSFTRINPLGIMVNAKSKNVQATVDFLLWVTGKEGGLVYSDFGGANPRSSIVSNTKYFEERPWYPELFEAMKGGVGSIRIAEASIIRDIFNKWASLALNGDVSVDEAFAGAEAEIKDNI